MSEMQIDAQRSPSSADVPMSEPTKHGQPNLRIDSGVDKLTQRNVETIAKMERAVEEQRTGGEKIADGIAAMVGSWPFIITQSVLLFLWIVLNVVAFFRHWDPYPFILLNLALSFQAAYTGPIVMMSQNRQSAQADRRNRLDLQINLLSEQENTEIIRMLKLMCAKHGIELDGSADLHVMEQQTKPDILVAQLEEAAQNVQGDLESGGKQPQAE